MPVYLPPLSRRKFIGLALAAGASTLLRNPLQAAEAKTDPHAWALISDLHLAQDQAKAARNTNMAENFRKVAADVAALDPRPAAALVSGDLAFNTGEPGDYQTGLELMRPIREAGLPMHLTLGNHDAREHFWKAFTEAAAEKRPVADRQAMILRSERVNWFILDTLEKTNSTPGFLGDEQIEWLRGALDANKEKPAFVLAHHNLNVIGDAKMSLKDSDKLLEVIRPRKQVKAYIFGHTHTWETKKDESGIHLVNLPPTAYVFQEGRPNGWVHLTVNENSASFKLNCLDKSRKDHGETFNLEWRKG